MSLDIGLQVLKQTEHIISGYKLPVVGMPKVTVVASAKVEYQDRTALHLAGGHDSHMKRHILKRTGMQIAALAFTMVLFASCDLSGGNGAPSVSIVVPDPDSNQTRVIIDNSANPFPVSVFWHGDRQDGHRIGTGPVEGRGISSPIVFTPFEEGTLFHLIHYVSVEGHEFPLRMGTVFQQIPAGITTRVGIRPLSELVPSGDILVNYIFLYIRNSGSADALRLLRDNAIVRDRQSVDVVVNPGQRGLFDNPHYIIPGCTDPFSIVVGALGIGEVFAFPPNLSTLEPGHFYFLEFDGTAVNYVRTVPIAINSASVAGGDHVPGANFAAQLSWLQANAQSGGNYVIDLTERMTLANPVELFFGDRNDIVITLRSIGEARTISLSQNGTLFSVSSGITLVLEENVTLQGRNNNWAPLVRVDDGGLLIINIGTRIAGNTNISTGSVAAGGAVRVNSGGLAWMHGGEIAANSSEAGGGGVFVASGGRFDMFGGTITGNGTSLNGGGVHIANGGVFDMRNGAISSNSAFSGGGVSNAGVFRMGGGIIHGRNAAAGLENTLTFVGSTGAALWSTGTSQYGVFGSGDAFEPRHSLVTSNYTIHVEGGFQL